MHLSETHTKQVLCQREERKRGRNREKSETAKRRVNVTEQMSRNNEQCCYMLHTSATIWWVYNLNMLFTKLVWKWSEHMNLLCACACIFMSVFWMKCFFFIFWNFSAIWPPSISLTVHLGSYNTCDLSEMFDDVCVRWHSVVLVIKRVCVYKSFTHRASAIRTNFPVVVDSILPQYDIHACAYSDSRFFSFSGAKIKKV